MDKKGLTANGDDNLASIVDFLFEAGMLKKTPRSGYQFLGHGSESVADHSFRAAIIAHVLGKMNPQADIGKLIQLVLFHDLAEARTGDLNYVNKRYLKADEQAAVKDSAKGLFFGREIAAFTDEFNAADTLEAKLASDADQLDMILELQEYHNLGNPYAQEWLVHAGRRLKTESGKKLFEEIITTDHTRWWFEKRPELWSK